jgi:hypothetical protein
VSWGPPPEAARPSLKLRSWKRIERPGSTLLGLAAVAIPIGRVWLEVDDLPIFLSHGKAWAAWPARLVITKEGAVARILGTSKLQYVNILRWSDRETSQRFSRAVVDLVRQYDPGAFDGEVEQ